MALAAANLRHDAKGAVVVASLNYANEVADPSAPRQRQGLSLRVVVASFEIRQEILVLADRDHSVELRELPPKHIALFGNDAPGDRDGALGRLPGLELVQLGVHAVL